MLWKTCELFNFTCFSHLFHRVWNCWDPVNRAFFTRTEPMQNPVSFSPLKKPVKGPVKNFKNLWTFSVFHMVENVKTCEQGIFHRVRTHAKPCEFLPCEKTCERPWENPVNFHSVFHRVDNVKTCEQGIFHRDRTCEKPPEMGVYLVLGYMQAILFNSEP